MMQSAGGERRYDALAIVSLVLICFGVYANSLHNPLLRDDKIRVLDDRRTTDPNHWRNIFTERYWPSPSNPMECYRPLTTLSFLLNHMVTGSSPCGYRVVNVALHAGVCIALYALGIRLLNSRLAAWIAAILFAVHAVHTEAVVTIVGRADIMTTLLLVVVAWLLLGRTDDGGCKAWRWTLVLGLSAVALFWKESAFTVLPLVLSIQIWQWWTSKRADRPAIRDRRYLLREIALAVSIAAVCVAALCLRYTLFGRLARPRQLVNLTVNPLAHAELGDRLLTAAGLLGKYLRLLAWPHPLCCDYGYNQIPVAHSLTDPPVLMGLAWVAGIGMALWLTKRLATSGIWHAAVWSAAFFLITYSMSSNTFHVIMTIFAERLIYLPSIGWCLGFGMAIAALARRRRRAAQIVVGAVCVGVLSANAVLTVQRNGDWRDELTLWEQSVQACPNSSRCWSSLATTYAARNRFSQAAKCMERALAIYDGFWEDQVIMAKIWEATRDIAKAAAAQQRACQLAPRDQRAELTYRLASYRELLRQPVQAMRAYEAVVELDPNNAMARSHLALLQTLLPPPLRNLDAAASNVERALQLAPKHIFVLGTAAEVYMASGQRERAIESMRRAVAACDKRHPLRARLQQRLRQLTATAPAATRH